MVRSVHETEGQGHPKANLWSDFKGMAVVSGQYVGAWDRQSFQLSQRCWKLVVINNLISVFCVHHQVSSFRSLSGGPRFPAPIRFSATSSEKLKADLMFSIAPPVPCWRTFQDRLKERRSVRSHFLRTGRFAEELLLCTAGGRMSLRLPTRRIQGARRVRPATPWKGAHHIRRHAF